MKLQEIYEVKTSLLRLERRSEEIAETLKQAKYDLRCSDDKLLNYQGSIRSIVDKLFGKQEEKLENLRRAVRTAEATIQSLKQKQESLKQQREELTQILDSLPSPETLRAEGETEWAALEAAYCVQVLTPLLGETHEALLEYRSLLQGSLMRILTFEEQQQITSEPHLRAEKCRPWLQRLMEAKEILGESFDPGAFFNSPAAYLVAAAKHNRLDKANQALSQVEALQRAVRNL